MAQNTDGDDLDLSANMWSSSGEADEYSVGDQVGPYTIREVLGEGGYGTVYLAHQTHPVERDVALKVLKPGMDSRQFVSRFEAERQALAIMSHPGVAKVYDAGQTARGRPYFVMEHVPGVAITRYCDDHRLSLDERLELFLLVCEAVQHAHTKGVVHRDLKPGNILVTEINGGPVPKIIDFGVAKALYNKLSRETVFTLQGQLIGTPEYMSPEQADSNEHAVDIRSDVYSLGVILYELLTGLLPLELSRHGGMLEMRQMVKDLQPPRPTARLRGDAQALQRARNRSVDQRAHLSRLRGDLDWIVMRCIEKDPARRYPTANALAEDIRRHLRDEPITAGPPGTAYRVGKFVRRNRTAVAAALLVALALFAATFVSVAFAMREARQRFIAQASEDQAVQQTARALAAEAEATARAEELRIVADFQSAMLREIDVEMMGVLLRADVMAAADAAWWRAELDEDEIQHRHQSLDRLLADANFTTAAVRSLDRNVLARSIDTIERDFSDQPLVKASLLETVAETYCVLGLFDAALQPRSHALNLRREHQGDDHPDTMTVRHHLGELHRQLGQFDAAVAHLNETIDMRKRVLGEQHADTLRTMHALGLTLLEQGNLDLAEATCQGVLEARLATLGDDHPDTLDSFNGVGRIAHAQGRVEEAEGLYRRAYEGHRRISGDENEQTLVSMNNLARALRELGEDAEAERFLLEAVDTLRRTMGDHHPTTLHAVNNMGRLMREQNRHAEAERYYREALEGFDRAFGPNHPNTLVSLNNVGRALRAMNRLEEAEDFYRRALEGRKAVYGLEHPSTQTSLNNVGFVLRAQRKLAEAEQYYRAAMDNLIRLHGVHHPNVARASGNLGMLMIDMERYEDAAGYLRQSVEAFRNAFADPSHGETLNAMNNLANLLRRMHEYEEAASIGAEVVQLARESMPPDHRHLGFYVLHYGRSLLALQRFSEAEQCMLEAHRIHAAGFGPAHERTRGVVERIIELYVAWHEAEPESGYDARALAWLNGDE